VQKEKNWHTFTVTISLLSSFRDRLTILVRVFGVKVCCRSGLSSPFVSIEYGGHSSPSLRRVESGSENPKRDKVY
jgi:hypothetical protein